MSDNNIESEIEKFLEQYEKLKDMKADAISNLSKSDTKLSALYHKIEGVKITHVSQSHNLIIQLKEVLAQRREHKKEAMLTQSIVDNLNSAVGNVTKKNKQILERHKAIEEAA